MKVALLEAPIGGLGDGLLFSTLPERLSTLGYRVHLSKSTKCRNHEVFDLLYARNPYLHLSDFEEWIDSKRDLRRVGIVHEKSFFLAARRYHDPIACIEDLHGLGQGQYDRPKIYYTPRIRMDFFSRVVVDPTSISQGFPGAMFDQFYERLGFDGMPVVLRSPHSGHNGRDAMQGAEVYTVADLYEYIDIIASARAFVCTESGQSSLAAAVRADNTFALCTTMHLNSRFYVWPNVNYTVTGSLSGDYLANDRTAEGVGLW